MPKMMGKKPSYEYKGANVPGGKYTKVKEGGGDPKDCNGSFEAPPGFTGSHRRSTGVPRFKGHGTHFKGKK
jgi:hypothetical protein